MTTNSERIKKIRKILKEKFSPSELIIDDESEDHIGHAGAASGGGHFALMITSDVFEGKSLVRRHQLIYQALSIMMEKDIHALSIKAKTSEES